MLKNTFVIFVTVTLFTAQSTASLDVDASLQGIASSVFNDVPSNVNQIIDDALSEQDLQLFKRSLDDTFTQFEKWHLKLIHSKLVHSILRRVLASRSISLEKVQDDLTAANGDPVKIVAIVNEAVGENILKIDGDVINFDFPTLIEFIRNNINQLLETIFQHNVIALLVVKNSIDKNIEEHYSQWQEELEDKSIPVSLVEKLFSVSSFNRFKRSLDGNGTSADNFLLDFLKSELKAVIEPFVQNIDNSLDQFVVVLGGFLTNAEPTGYLANITAHFTNLAVKQLIQVVVLVKSKVDNIFDNLIGVRSVARLRRSVSEDPTGVTVPSAGGFSFFSIIFFPFKIVYNISFFVIHLGFKIVWTPIRFVINIFGPTFKGGIFSIFGTITSLIYQLVYQIYVGIRSIISSLIGPLNCTVKRVVVNIIARIKDTIASILLLPIQDFAFKIVDYIIPCDAQCVLTSKSISIL